jgi:3-phosphoshikimate 1-carboxyvinyltransferase
MTTIGCLKELGAECSIEGDTIRVRGVDASQRKKPITFDCKSTGSTLGFMLPIAMASGKKAVFEGDEKLFEKPHDACRKVCEAQKIKFKKSSSKISVHGQLKPGDYSILGTESSHFISGLIYSLASQNGRSRIFIAPPIDGKNYIDNTIKVLAKHGVDVEWGGLSMIDIRGKKFTALDVEIEGDWSAAAYYDTLNTAGGEVEIEGLLEDSVQADKIYPDLFRQLREDESPEIDLTEHPDLAPALFVYAALNRGAIFRGLSRYKPKEKLCLEKLAKELSKLNVFLALGEETAIINRSLIKPSSVPLQSNGDHRAVMALSVLLTITGGSIEGAEIVNDSVPQFFDRLKELGVDFRIK